MNPLISVIVLSYNSSRFIIETLNSIKAQTYKNIELIIGDDGSTDNTLLICSNWLSLNSNRFVESKIITVEKNTGTSSNCNRSIRTAKGEWIKEIAADDILEETCIEKNLNYVLNNPGIAVLQSDTYIIDEESNIIGISDPIDKIFKDNRTTAFFQHEMLLLNYYSNTTTLFIKKDVIEKVGYYDESISLMEDTQMWLRLTHSGYKIYFMDEITTRYRVNLNSVKHDNGDSKLINSIFIYATMTVEKYIYPHLHGFKLFVERYRIFITNSFMNSSFNHNNKIGHFVWKLVSIPYMIPKKIFITCLKRKIESSFID